VEDSAAAAAAFVLGAKAQRRDTSRREGMRDFDLVFDGGHREPFEVTQHAHEPTRRTLARLEGGFDADELDHVWTVWIPECEPGADGADQPYDVASCRREIVPVLADLEEAGIDRLDDQSIWTDPRLSSFAPTVASTGLYAARSLGRRGNDVIRPLFLRQYGRRDRGMRLHVIAEAVEMEAADDGNRRKLATSNQARRSHLFLRVDIYSASDCYSAVRQAFESGRLPPEPKLPSPITTAWVASSTEVFVITPPGRWKAHRIPPDVNEHPELWLLDSAE
jgi:hypothetical protein